jgi:hypothetical protein
VFSGVEAVFARGFASKSPPGRAIAFGKKNLARRLEVAGYFRNVGLRRRYTIAAEGRLRKS